MYNPDINKQTTPKNVKPLNNNVARKIAAGEVIDRPNAVLREFLDNAIDASSSRIIVELEGGGIESIRVVDNGWGMSKADLEICAKPHVTSKIENENDLENLYTLGFRGEALASIAAVSRLSITSTRDSQAWQLDAFLEKNHEISPSNLHEGTIALSKALFENFPARRQFLKRPQTEGNLCKQTFIEKALPFTDITFRLSVDNAIKMDLPSGQSLSSRFTSVLDMSNKESLFYEVSNSQEQWRVRLVLGEPSVYRNDRKHMFIFVNNRRVQEYAFLQAIDYGAEGYFPNGTHPVAALFIDIDPSLVDFNIHPAKKEVRFKDMSPIHRAVSSLTRNFYTDFSVRGLTQPKNTITENIHERSASFLYGTENPYNSFTQGAEKQQNYIPTNAFSSGTPSSFFQNSYSQKSTQEIAQQKGNININKLEQNDDEYSFRNESKRNDFRYIGFALDVFLLVEKDNEILVVDQHAGHERILYENFLKTAGQKQMLLIPLVLETQSANDDTYITELLPQLESAGFSFKDCGEGRWEVYSVPVSWRGSESDLFEDLLENRMQPNELIRSLASRTACRAAIKDGHMLDSQTAYKLLQDIFELEDPHCPHGRPLWAKISKEELFSMVRRT